MTQELYYFILTIGKHQLLQIKIKKYIDGKRPSHVSSFKWPRGLLKARGHKYTHRNHCGYLLLDVCGVSSQEC